MSLISHRSAATSIFYSTYKFRLQRLFISCLYLCSTYKFDGICNILSLRSLLVDQLSAFNASHRVRNKPYDHRLHKGISQSDSTESHSLRQGSSSFRCLSSGLFSPYAALHVLKHSTTSFTGTGGFVNICPTPAVVIILIHEWKVLHDRMKTEN